jgi:hypothetical protein
MFGGNGLTKYTQLEGQLAENTPPVTGEVLMAQGLSRHEALHRMRDPLGR